MMLHFQLFPCLWSTCANKNSAGNRLICYEIVHTTVLLQSLVILENRSSTFEWSCTCTKIVLTTFLLNFIPSSYNICCQKLLVDVFEGLMLPLPASLCYSGLPTDESHISMVSTPSTCPPLSIISQEDSQRSCISKQQLQDDDSVR